MFSPSHNLSPIAQVPTEGKAAADVNREDVLDMQDVTEANTEAQGADPNAAPSSSQEDACSVADGVSEDGYDIITAARQTSAMLQQPVQPDDQQSAGRIQAYQSICKALQADPPTRGTARKLPDLPTYCPGRPGSAFGHRAPQVWWVVLKGIDPGIYMSVDAADNASGGLADTRIIPSLSLKEATSTYFAAKGKEKVMFV